MAMQEIMEKEQVIAFLNVYRDIDGNVNILRKIIKDMDSQYYTPPTAVQDGLPKGKNNISCLTEQLALNIPDDVSDTIKAYEEEISQWQRLKTEILKEISRLPLRQKSIIFDKYIYGFKWEQVAVHNNYSERQCKNIRNTAINDLAKRFYQNKVISDFEMKRYIK